MTNVTDVSLNGLNAVRGEEGRALRAYQDSVGVWTIGYGLTNYDRGLGFKVGPGVTITEDQAESLLLWSLRANYLPDVLRHIDTAKVSHPQGAVDGGTSFHFNTGGISKASWPARLNAGDLGGAQAGLESWNKAGGRVLADLVRRRAHEWGIISAENYGHLSGPEIEDDYGRAIGHASLLTALPGHPPAVITPGDVQKTGPVVPAAPAPGVLGLGSKGPDVLAVQKQLVDLGYPAPVSGTYDDATVIQVTEFQRHHPHLTADGLVGPATRAGLVRALAMRDKTKTVAKVAPAVPAAAGAAHAIFGLHVSGPVLILGIGLIVAGLAYVAWKHRAEIQHAINSALERTVV